MTTIPRNSARRPVPRPVEPTAPALRIAPRRSTHWRDGVMWAGLGCAGFGVAPLVGYPMWDVPALAVGVGGGAAVVVSGHRDSRRRDLQDALVEALAPLLGLRQLDRRVARTGHWTNGWPGVPRKIAIRYAPAAPDSDPMWVQEVLAIVASRLMVRYEVTNHDRSRRRLSLRVVLKEPDAGATPPANQMRAERAIAELIGPTAQIAGVTFEGQDLHSITVHHQAGAKLAAAGYRTRIERVISTMLPGRWRAMWNLEEDSVIFEVRPLLPASVWMPIPKPQDNDDLLRKYRDVKIPCAIDEEGEVIYWYPARVPHAMATGTTGSGKTSFGHALVGTFTSQFEWPVWVLDAKRVEYLRFRDWPNVQIVAGSVPAQVALVHRAWALMEERYKLIELGEATVNDFEPLVVFLDEYAEFRNNLMEWYSQIKVKGDPPKPPTLLQVASLMRKARTARIHLVLSTQRPDAEFLGGEMRDNLGFRVSMGRLSPQGAMMMWENPATGVSLPRDRTGRAMATHLDGRPVEVQCFRFPDLDAEPGSEEHQLLDQIRPKQSRHPRLLITPAEPRVDSETGDVAPVTFRDHAQVPWVLASDRPDLDPLAHTGGDDTRDRRARSSTLASLGLDTEHSATVVHRDVSSILAGTPANAPTQELPHYETAEDTDENAGYAPATNTDPWSLVVGDLIEADAGSGQWVVVDEDPEGDVVSPGMVAISWRGDDDEFGSLSLPDDTDVAVRRPEILQENS